MKEIEVLLKEYKEAVYEKDIPRFIKLFDEEVLVFDMWQQWEYKGITAWTVMVENWFNSLGTNRDELRFEEVVIHEQGLVAVVTAIARFAAVSQTGEELRYLQNRLTWVLQKKEVTWKIIHQHTSSPIDFETMKPILKK